jgi:hypothetical protein
MAWIVRLAKIEVGVDGQARMSWNLAGLMIFTISTISA